MDDPTSKPTDGSVTRVFLVDDHELVREGLRWQLRACPFLRVVGDAGSHADAMARIPATRPDLVVLELQLPDADGLTTCHEILTRMPEVRVVVLTASSDAVLRRGARRAGAADYLVKSLRSKEIVDALRCVATGEATLAGREGAPPEAIGGRPDEEPLEGAERLVATLTPMEQRILWLITEGRTNEQIARRLGLSVWTVKRSVSSIIATLGVSSRVGAAVIGGRCRPAAPTDA